MISFGCKLPSGLPFSKDGDSLSSASFFILRSSASILLLSLPLSVATREEVETFVVAVAAVEGFFNTVVDDDELVVVGVVMVTAVVEVNVLVAMSSESESSISAKPFDMSPFANDVSDGTVAGMLKLFAANRVL